MNRYTVSSIIGEGSFGRVYKAIRKDDNITVAIKVISKRGRSNKDLKNLRRECEIQAHLNHPNIIEMFESFETKHDLVVVTEFAYTDFHRYLARNGVLPENQAQRLICHLVSALYYLHSNRILHRDLKPQNVLINRDLHAKLCDFGLARNMTMGTHVLTSIKGTPLYMAPELLAERPYDHLADLWSLGCISYESIAGQPPFCTTSILHLVKMIKHEEVKWPSTLSSDCKSFLQGLLEKEPSLRATWTQILCHPFVENKLYMCDNKETNSPFIKPHPAKKTNDDKLVEECDLNEDFKTMSINNTCNTADYMTTSRDSINAIPPSDVENLETDFEDAVNCFPVPFASNSFDNENINEGIELTKAMPLASPIINSQTVFVAENHNMILNHLYDNFDAGAKIPINANSTKQMKKSRNKDLEKRKLSQNLENFSLRLGQPGDVELQRKSASNDACAFNKKKVKDAESQEENKSPTSVVFSSGEQQSSDNSPPCLLPGWDSCDESQSPPIENDEWLAFLNRSMQEVIDGELDSLKQHNLVSIIVAPLRNSHAIPKVVQSVAQLLSLPFALDSPKSVIEIIETVYIEVKLVPNLMYACKLLFSQRNAQDSTNSLPHQSPSQSIREFRNINEFSIEEIQTCSRLFELMCYLVHLRHQFLSQFCDAVVILAANDLLINFLNNDFKSSSALRIANCIVASLCCVLRESPENAELIEKIVFDPKLNLLHLLEQTNQLMRLRMCMLLRLLARFSVVGLQNVWCADIKKAIKCIAMDTNRDVTQEAEGALEELKKFSFF